MKHVCSPKALGTAQGTVSAWWMSAATMYSLRFSVMLISPRTALHHSFTLTGGGKLGVRAAWRCPGGLGRGTREDERAEAAVLTPLAQNRDAMSARLRGTCAETCREHTCYGRMTQKRQPRFHLLSSHFSCSGEKFNVQMQSPRYLVPKWGRCVEDKPTRSPCYSTIH